MQGYDLDCCPPKWFHVPFRPIDVSNAKQNDEDFYKELINAAQFAINEINAEMVDIYTYVYISYVVVNSDVISSACRVTKVTSFWKSRRWW